MPARKSNLEAVFSKNHIELTQLQKKSIAWFQGKVREMSGLSWTKNPRKVLMGQEELKTNRIIPGHLYMFVYDAKHKDTLPYYDMFPMVLPYEQVKGGFMGLNIHYLPYSIRIKLFSALQQFRNNNKMDETTKLKYSWALIKGATKFVPTKPCIKHYLYSHVSSPFKKVIAKDWITAILLPVEQFTTDKRKVWADSQKIILRG